VDGREHDRRERRRDRLAAPFGHAEARAEQRLRRSRAEAADRARLERRDLGLEPGPAGAHLVRARLLVQAPLAALGPLEVLDRVGHVDALARQARLGERALEQAPGRADEREPGPVLRVARLLADEQHVRARGSRAEDGLRPALPQLARAAARRGAAQRRQVRLAVQRRVAPRGGVRVRRPLAGHGLLTRPRRSRRGGCARVRRAP
jgi:hypothetical protein